MKKRSILIFLMATMMTTSISVKPASALTVSYGSSNSTYSVWYQSGNATVRVSHYNFTYNTGGIDFEWTIQNIDGKYLMYNPSVYSLDVKALQNMLILEYGIYGCTLEADGYFGYKTEAAVKNFQAKYNLGNDGIAGPRTLNTLVAVVNGK